MNKLGVLTTRLAVRALSFLINGFLVKWLFNKYLLSIFVPIQLPGLTWEGFTYVQALALLVVIDCLFKVHQVSVEESI